MRGPDFSDDQLIAGLRAAAAELGEPLTAGAYDTWQRGRSDAASPALLIRRLGSWRGACEAAGLRANSTRSTSRRWTDDEVVAIVARYLESPGATGSFADYSEWARVSADAPSGATLRQRGSWAAIKNRARGLID
ncbi:homing endonuclease associated repeat-containing protein [Nocardioides ultimimeridianus]